MNIKRIALTGGPGGGKTEAVRQIIEHFSSPERLVIAVQETATDLILAGLSPRGVVDNRWFQGAQLDLQMFKEDLYVETAKKSDYPEVLLVCDRGILDGEGFTDHEIFDEILENRNLERDSLMQRYDAIFHMTTAAKGEEHAYTLSNNPARKETPVQAAEEDDRLLQIYASHPHRVIIPAAPTSQLKNQALFAAIEEFLHDSADAETD